MWLPKHISKLWLVVHFELVAIFMGNAESINWLVEFEHGIIIKIAGLAKSTSSPEGIYVHRMFSGPSPLKAYMVYAEQ